MTPVIGGTTTGDVLELEIDELLDVLAGPEAMPASGSVAAIVVAMAAALAEKAARRSRAAWAEAGGAIAQAQALRLRAAPLAGADARAFTEAAELLESGPDEPAEERDWQLGRALARAAEVPLLIAQIGADVAALAKEVAERGSGEVRGDAAGAAALAHAATRAAAHLVEINLGTTSEDLRVLSARSLAAAAEAWAAAALALER